MTLVAVWVRKAGKARELVIASDSRLTPFTWDVAPKILPLPRGDSVLAFAGNTDVAYPIMIQMSNAVDAWDWQH